ncbi:MAG: serine/threonine-protein kinase, partial [Myxococcota bacterium]
MAFPLGPFLLQKPLARGGTAEVWRAVHESEGHPVAVKVMMTELARDPAFRTAFRTEVRAVAALGHPNVVPIYDFGEIPASTEEAVGGRLAAGSPYLVMELAPLGSLSRRRGKLGWGSLRRSLVGILRALAHAHANGMLHCDLKPGNLLVHPGDQVRLGDFGLARARNPHDDGPVAGGTPTYMAPEQFTQHWRAFGPWTDLYGLGCVAWVLACGTPPFGDGSTAEETRDRHLAGAIAPFTPSTPVPDGFEAWIHRAIAVDPADRFQ